VLIELLFGFGLVTCIELNNFNTVFAIYAGLHNSAVTRLAKTWNKMGKKECKKLKMWKQELLSTERNFMHYRTLLAATAPPLIPYLALLSKDLYSIEEGNPTELELGKINVEKLRMLWKLCEKFKTYRCGYNLAGTVEVKKVLERSFVCDGIWGEGDLYDVSRSIEAGKSGKDKGKIVKKEGKGGKEKKDKKEKKEKKDKKEKKKKEGSGKKDLKKERDKSEL